MPVANAVNPVARIIVALYDDIKIIQVLYYIWVILHLRSCWHGNIHAMYKIKFLKVWTSSSNVS